MSINPAYAGAREAIAIVMDMRKQWVSFPGAPTTMNVRTMTALRGATPSPLLVLKASMLEVISTTPVCTLQAVDKASLPSVPTLC